MKNILCFLLTLVLMISATSCLTLMNSSESSGSYITSNNSYYNNNNNRYLYLKKFQTINENEALAYTRKGDIVKIESSRDIYYDGNIISGRFAFVGTYTYETVSKAGDTDEYRKKKFLCL